MAEQFGVEGRQDVRGVPDDEEFAAREVVGEEGGELFQGLGGWGGLDLGSSIRIVKIGSNIWIPEL
ncbi:hypothetical protein ABZ621_30980 [Streptomyces sp. NPDC007863]|uniref:hypothetical protein n=1 Tax=Streptomyces sp. NPDC007863 TaxID=3154894 RepID=UPI0033C1BF76